MRVDVGLTVSLNGGWTKRQRGARERADVAGLKGVSGEAVVGRLLAAATATGTAAALALVAPFPYNAFFGAAAAMLPFAQPLLSRAVRAVGARARRTGREQSPPKTAETPVDGRAPNRPHSAQSANRTKAAEASLQRS